MTMSAQIDWDFAGDNDARAEIGAAVRHLLKDATGNARDDVVREIIEMVRDVAEGQLPTSDARAATQPSMSGITYKTYVIDAFQRDTDRWRAAVRKSNGKKIRVAFPPSVLDEVTTSTDALTAEKAVEFAKTMIDGGGLI
jgi:hypothetical protein